MEFNPKNNIIDTNNKIEQMPFFDRKYVNYFFFIYFFLVFTTK